MCRMHTENQENLLGHLLGTTQVFMGLEHDIPLRGKILPSFIFEMKAAIICRKTSMNQVHYTMSS